MARQINLMGVTWNHSRGFTPLAATAQRVNELHPDVEITWFRRSLQAFADRPLTELAEGFDLIVIDHPWVGFAAAHDTLLPLDELLPKDFLADQAEHSVGASHASYSYAGHQWALAIDAACPVSAARPDLLLQAGVRLPRTFDDVIALARRGLVCCPSIPLDVYGNFLNLCMAAGDPIFPDDQEVTSREGGLRALERLKALTDLIPDECFELDPIRSMERMSSTDRFAYAPYTYGYTNYSRSGYSENRLTFHDVVGIDADAPGSTMLGGTGLAISASCKNVEVAAAYAQYVADPVTQRGLFFEAGGQPGHRSAWTTAKTNIACSDFFTHTLPALDRAFVRPRYDGYLDFQDRAGQPIHDYLKHGGDPSEVLDQLNAWYRESTN